MKAFSYINLDGIVAGIYLRFHAKLVIKVIFNAFLYLQYDAICDFQND